MSAITPPPVIVEAFAAGGSYNVIPVAPPGTPGAASFDTGFPDITMTPIPSGGIPPSGKDMNGILRMISAHTAWLQAGGFYVFSAAVATAGGYPVNAVIRSASTPSVAYYNTLADNTNDPDSVITGWVAFPLLGGGPVGAQTPAALPSGDTNNFSVQVTTGFVDFSANAAGSNVTGFAGGVNGQTIIATNVSANPLTFKALTGSSAGNQLRLPADLTVLQYSNVTFRKSSTLGVWVPV